MKTVQKDGARFFGINDGFLPVAMDRRLGCGDHSGTHLDSLGPHRESSGHGFTINESSRRNDGYIDL